MKKITAFFFAFFFILVNAAEATHEDMTVFQKVKTFSKEYDFSNVKEQYEFVDFVAQIKSNQQSDQNIPELRFLIKDAWKKIKALKHSILEKIEKTYITLKQKDGISLLDIHEFYAEIAFAYDGFTPADGEPIKHLKFFFNLKMFESKYFIPIMLWNPIFDIEVMNYAFLKGIDLVGYGLNKDLFFHGQQWYMQRGANHDYLHGPGQMLLDVYQPIYNYAFKNKDKKLMYSLFWIWHEVKFNLNYRRDVVFEELEEHDFPREEPPIFLEKRLNFFKMLTLQEKIKYIAEQSQKDQASFDFLAYNPIVAEMDDEEGRLYYYKKFIYPSKALLITWKEGEEKDQFKVIFEDKDPQSFECISYTAFCRNRIGSMVDEVSFLKDLGVEMKNPYKLQKREGELFKDTPNPHKFQYQAVVPEDYNLWGKELNALFKEHIFNYLYNLADDIAKESEKIIN